MKGVARGHKLDCDKILSKFVILLGIKEVARGFKGTLEAVSKST